MVAEIHGQNGSSVSETVMREKEICSSLAVAPQTARVKATVNGKCSVKMGKALD